MSLGKRSITAYFDKELSSNKVQMQPKISTALNIESKDILGQAWAKFFQANDIAGRKANCPYFRAAMKITQNLGPAPIPTAKEIDGIYLDKNYEEAGKERGQWKKRRMTTKIVRMKMMRRMRSLMLMKMTTKMRRMTTMIVKVQPMEKECQVKLKKIQIKSKKRLRDQVMAVWGAEDLHGLGKARGSRTSVASTIKIEAAGA